MRTPITASAVPIGVLNYIYESGSGLYVNAGWILYRVYAVFAHHGVQDAKIAIADKCRRWSWYRARHNLPTDYQQGEVVQVLGG